MCFCLVFSALLIHSWYILHIVGSLNASVCPANIRFEITDYRTMTEITTTAYCGALHHIIQPAGIILLLKLTTPFDKFDLSSLGRKCTKTEFKCISMTPGIAPSQTTITYMQSRRKGGGGQGGHGPL